MVDENNPEEILGNYKKMMAECQQIASKISEVSGVVCICVWVSFCFSCQLKEMNIN